MAKERFNNMQNTAPVLSALDNQELDIPSSAFNLGFTHHTQAHIGSLMPVMVKEVNPHETWTININAMCLSRNPLVRRLNSGMRLYFHAYYCRSSDLFKGFNNAVTKGRSGTVDKSIPKLITSYKNKDGTCVNTLTPFSPANYMGIPAHYYDTSNPLKAFVPVNPLLTEEEEPKVFEVGKETDFINALPFVMYNKIYRDYYLASNIVQENEKWFPLDDDDFILSYNCTEANVIDYGAEKNTSNLGTTYGSEDEIHVPIGDSTPPVLNVLHFRQFKGDYFNTCLPFPDLIRGDIPTMDLSTAVGNIDWDDCFTNPLGEDYSSTTTADVTMTEDTKIITGGQIKKLNLNNYTVQSSISGGGDSLKKVFERAKLNLQVTNSINLNNLRALEAYTIFMERNARASGDYNSLIKAQFGYDPHTWERKPQYIGGCYQDIVFNEVVQTSESSTTPLGSKASNAISASNGYIGKFDVPDFGYIMVIASIVPDVIYTQGQPRMFSRKKQSEYYFPILNNLAPQPILNKELYISGDPDIDDDVFGYTERFSEYKSSQNYCSGLCALSHEYADFDASCILARRFSDTPQLNNNFLTMSPDNIDMSIFSVADEPPFDLSMNFVMDAVRRMPWTSQPGGLSTRG